jgi:hypothetical protein
MIEKVDQNIWVSEQLLKYWGLEVGTRMTIIRLTNEELMVISPIKVDSNTIEQINQLGNIAFIVAPNLFHYLFLADFKNFYPQAKICAVSELGAKLPDLSIDKVLNSDKNIFGNEVEYLLFRGFKIITFDGIVPLKEIVFFHQESKTLILTDTAFNFDESFPLQTQLATRLIQSYKQLRPSLLEKIATQEKEQIKQSVQKILNWDFNRVIVAHGSIVENNGKEKLKAGYEWFLDTKL